MPSKAGEVRDRLRLTLSNLEELAQCGAPIVELAARQAILLLQPLKDDYDLIVEERKGED